MQQAYEDAKAKLMNPDGTPSRKYEAYLRHEQEHARKTAELNAAYGEALANPMKLQMWPIEGRAYHDEVDRAMDRWVSLGFKCEIENAIHTLEAQAGDEANDFLSRLRAGNAG
jgi:hypothetical protein